MRARITANYLAEMPVRWEGLIVTFAYQLVAGRVEVARVWIDREEGPPVPAARPPMARLGAQALRELREHWAPTILRLRPSETAVAAAEALIGTPGPRRGRPPLYGPGHWDDVAQVAAEGGIPAVMNRWPLSYSTAWRWVRRTQEDIPSPAAEVQGRR